MVTQGGRSGTEGTERDGTDTGSGSNGIDAGGNSNAGRMGGGQRVRMLLLFVIVSLLLSFLHFTLFLF